MSKLDYISNDYARGYIASRNDSHKGVHVPLSFIDICDGNMYDAILFAQIMYWHEPSKENGQTRLRRTHEGHLWIAKNHGDWYEECRIKQQTIRKCLERLKDSNLIHYELVGEKGKVTPFIRINWNVFEQKMKAWENKQPPVMPEHTPVISEQGTLLQEDIPLLSENDSNTENTTESKTENTSKKKTHIPSSDGDVSKQDIQSSTDNIDLNVDEPTNNQALILINTYMSYAKSKDVRLKGKGLASARDLVKAGITTDDIRDWYQERSKSKWVVDNRNGVPTWWMLTEEIITWRDKRKTKLSAANGHKAVEGRYVDKSGDTSVTSPEYRKQYGLPDVTESDVPSFLLDETKG